MDELAAEADDTKGILDNPVAQADDPAQPDDCQDLPNGAAPKSDQALPEAEERQDAEEEAEPEVPVIPADMPAHILMSRQADRSAVNAPTEAVGESACLW